MVVWKYILFLRDRARQQKAYMVRYGTTVEGYIAHFGDPGTAPVARNNDEKTKHLPFETIRITKENQHLIQNLKPVFNNPDNEHFFAPHIGDGGTKCHRADLDRLQFYEKKLAEVESNNHAATLRADAEARRVQPAAPQGAKI